MSEWSYVPGERDPADVVSKHSKMDNMLANRQWLEDPGFWWKDSRKAMIALPPLSTEDPEVRKENRI